ncbi:hypothetical protein BGZ79_001892 [Entomortierella chlamydospora]|nr:hypothetical protein BGZ79_001892 [Entomortierella chlamydospora]
MLYSYADTAEVLISVGRGHGNTTAQSGHCGLSSGLVGNWVRYSMPCTLALTQYHADTLARSETPWCTISLVGFSDLVQGLPELQPTRRCVSLSDMAYYDASNDGLDMDVISKKQWSCLPLTGFDVKILLTWRFESVLGPD